MSQGFADRSVVTIMMLCEESDPEARRWCGHVAFNRCALNPARYGATPGAVCEKRMQFSEFLPDPADNANLERVLALPETDPAVIEVLAIYDAIADGEPDPTGGATGFYATTIAAPAWTVGATFTGQRGRTRYYANVK